MSSGGVVGFDFGNNNCVICQAKRGGIDTVLNESSKRKSTTYVSFSGNQRFMGEPAVSLARSNFKNTVTNVKRLIGRNWSDPDVQADIKRMTYPQGFVQVDGDKIGCKVMYNDEEHIFSPEEITAMMLNSLRKTVAVANEGAGATDIVVSVPGYWNEKQRKAMLDACTISGFKALRLLNDHTAAALAYGIYKSARNVFDTSKKQYVMFVDIGAADTSVAIVSFIQGKLQVVSAAYDSNLGGRDFDEYISNRMADDFKAKHNLDPRTNAKAMIKLKGACEKAKQTLTPEGVAVAKLHVEFLMNEIDFKGELTLDDMEDMCAPLLARLQGPLEQCVKDSKLSLDEINSVEIVGGGTRVRCVKRTIANVLKLDQSQPNYGLSTTLNADECVARGCALNSAMLSPQFRVKEFVVADCVDYPIKLTWDQTTTEDKMEVDDKDVATNFVVIAKKGEETPISRRVSFRRRESFNIVATYDESAVLPSGTSQTLSSFKVAAPKCDPNSEEVPKIRVNFRHNKDGLFECLSAQYLEPVEEKVEEKPADESKKEETKASDEASKDDEKKTDGQEQQEASEPAEKKQEEKPKKTYKRIELEVQTTNDSGMSTAELEAAVKREQKFAAADKLIEETGAVRNELETYIYGQRDRIVGALRDFVTDEEKDRFNSALEAEENWLYDEGFDVEKEQYEKRLKALKEIGDRFEHRYVEMQERPRAHRAFTDAANGFLQIVNSPDENYAHLTDEEREKVRKACSDASTWLDQQSRGQEALSQQSDPVLTSAMINEELKKMQTVCQPIVNKKKPPPPKKEEEKKTEETPRNEAKNEEKDENMPDAEPAADADAGENDTSKDEDKMDTSSLD